MRRSILHIKQILDWADSYRARTGDWPTKKSGLVWEDHTESWHNIDQNLSKGLRGLRGGSSLPRLLAKHRARRNRKQLPHYSIDQIVQWAKHHAALHGSWPQADSGAVDAAAGETWLAIDMALRLGRRGMPGGNSLPQLLAEKLAVANRGDRPRLSRAQILKWADLHHQRTGNWPTADTGQIPESDGDTWLAIDHALKRGSRGLKAPSSLFKLLARHRHMGRHVRKPPLNEEQILLWADAFHVRTGRWPKFNSGTIPESPGDTWLRIQESLSQGKRGLSGGMSLAMLLATKRNVRSRIALPKLTERKIIAWARRHRRLTGRWPTRHSGAIPDTGGETWNAVAMALRKGGRGLGQASSLRLLLEPLRRRHRGAVRQA